MQRGCRIATSVGGTLTGEGGDFIIVDDPLSPAQALSKTFRKRAANWFDQALVTRLNDRKKRSYRSCDAQTPFRRFNWSPPL
ncbi:hypothetical protein wTkk_000691 [Wolbachia endosymbiont of Trichogramma kaykai]